MSEMIYKLVPRPLWQEAKEKGIFDGAPVDLSDGFIHFSTRKQVVETAHKHFKGQDDILLLTVSGEAVERLAEPVKWEVSRGGALFPHLYAPLPLEAVIREQALTLGPDGLHIFTPDLLA